MRFTNLPPLWLIFALPLALASPYCGLMPPSSLTARGTVQGGVGNSSTDDFVTSGWYAGWLGDQFPPSNISWSKYTHLTFAFALTTPDSSVISLDANSTALLPQFVEMANANGVVPLLSIGGWTGSQYYSTSVATAENRTAFVKAIVGLVNQYKLGGIDFDWEYPNHQGIGCNEISPDDSANFLSLLTELRADPVGADLILTAAVGLTPFAGADGEPMADVSAFAPVLSHIVIMNYDVWGSWSTGVGPNAPLNDTCATVKAGSAVSAVKAWTDAKLPPSQIALGVASYGHSFSVANSDALDGTTLKPYPVFNKNAQPKGDKDDDEAEGTDQCGNPNVQGGIFNFWGLADGGFLDDNGTAAAGIDYQYDDCSQTPYVYNPTTQVMVSYDDATSFAAKGGFISDMGLKGFAMWHIAGDLDNILVDSITAAMGLEEVCE